MRTRKRQVGLTVSQIFTPTIVGSLSHGKHTVAERHIPDGTPWAFDIDRAENALAALTGATLRDRQLVDLADGLHRVAAGEGNPADVLTGVMRKVPTGDQVNLADDYMSAPPRGRNSRAVCFYRLALGLCIPVESGESSEALKARALMKTLRRARKRLLLSE